MSFKAKKELNENRQQQPELELENIGKYTVSIEQLLYQGLYIYSSTNFSMN